MRFFLGTHQPHWLSIAAVPLFVSHRSPARRDRLPRLIDGGVWALDSGGFTQLSRFGRWTFSARTYARAVRRYNEEIGPLAHAAPMDWMCEEAVRRRTGLTVAEHQQATVANFLELRALEPSLPWIPVLQGSDTADYLAHLDAYQHARGRSAGRAAGRARVGMPKGRHRAHRRAHLPPRRLRAAAAHLRLQDHRADRLRCPHHLLRQPRLVLRRPPPTSAARAPARPLRELPAVRLGLARPHADPRRPALPGCGRRPPRHLPRRGGELTPAYHHQSRQLTHLAFLCRERPPIRRGALAFSLKGHTNRDHYQSYAGGRDRGVRHPQRGRHRLDHPSRRVPALPPSPRPRHPRARVLVSALHPPPAGQTGLDRAVRRRVAHRRPPGARRHRQRHLAHDVLRRPRATALRPRR